MPAAQSEQLVAFTIDPAGHVHTSPSPEPVLANPAAHVHVAGELELVPADEVELLWQATHCPSAALK